MEEEASLDVGTQNPPVFESTSIYDDKSRQETNRSDTNNSDEASFLHTAVVPEGSDSETKEETNADSETQPIADSILINTDPIDQEMDHFDSTNDTSFPADEAILLEEEAVIEKEANSIDAGVHYLPISDAILSNNDQAEQETSCSDDVNDTFIPDVETIPAEGDIETEKETNVDTETPYLPVSDSILTDSDQAEQETNRSNGTDEASVPVIEGILVEDGTETEKEANVDTETQYLPISDSILVDSDQAEKETNNSDSTDGTSLPDVAEILVENSSTTEKEADAEALYLPASDSILTNSDQVEQETNRADNVDEISLPDA
ncbi:MAG: hypothetical protein KAG66_16580, partial [Methylococcales bacterium]|nr:hypothetical protein [Methylococcales bacterium]